MFRNSTGTFYSVSDFNLYTINPATGAGTLVAALSFPVAVDIRALAFSPADVLFAINKELPGPVDKLYTINASTGVETLVGSTGVNGIQGLAFAPDETLYGWDSATLGLVTINPATGGVTDVNPAVGGTAAIQTIVFHSNGTLYGMRDDRYSIDPATGVFTLLGNFPSVASPDIRGAEFLLSGSIPTTVTIDQAAAQADPTNASPINFTVVFSEPVTGFTNTDIDLSGSTAGGTLTALVSDTGDSTTFTVTVTGMTTSGTVTASIAAAVATAAAGNLNTASTSTDNTVNFVPITFNPASGPPGTEVTITGTGFLDASLNSRVTQVFIAGHTNGANDPVAADSFTVFNNTTITAIVGAIASNPKPVEIVFVDGSVGTSATDFIIGPLPAELVLLQSDGADPVTVGDIDNGSLSYTIGVFNAGGSSADNVTVDTLSTGVTVTSCQFTVNFAPPTDCPDPQTVSLGTLAAATFADITIFADPPGVASQTFLENTAAVTTSSAELSTANNSFTVTTTVNPAGGVPQEGGGPPGGVVNALIADPVSKDTLYVGTESAGVFKSTDGGQNWVPVNNGLTNLTVSSFAFDPVTPAKIFAGTDDGVFKSDDGGENWTASNSGITGRTILSIAIDPVTPSTMYVGPEGGGVFKSTNSGATWAVSNTDMGNELIRDVVIDPVTPTTVYAASDGSGVFKSTNSGGNWTQVITGLSDLGTYVLGFDPFNPVKIYVATNDGVSRSIDGGQNWTSVNAGIEGLPISALVFSPFVQDDILAGSTDGIFRSTDGGANWGANNDGLDNLNILALSFESDQGSFLAGTSGGVYQGSEDFVITWSASNSGLTAATVTAMATDGDSVSVYAATQGAGVFRSDDDGISWFSINFGLPSPFQDLTSWVNEFGNATLIYGGDALGNVWKTTDAGITWALTSSLPSGSAGVTSFAIDPSTVPSTVFAATSSGVSKSTNGGDTWTAFNDSLTNTAVT
ncbi:MAG TPA: Ig-like domain-containing protein, partial [Methylococcaceae bacterium]|nr:Ig-like domain-containing protein [Methylococcaceae bacterium]